MKTIFTKGIIAFAIVALATSCSTSNDVASNRGIQKRKYNKGFFVSKNAKGLNHQNKDEQTKAIVINEEVVEVLNTQENVQNEMATEVKSTEVNNVAIIETAVSNDNNTRSINDNSPKTSNNTSETIDDDVTENGNVTKKDVKKVKSNINSNSTSSGDDMLILLVILAFLIPFVAVGIKTDWDVKKVVIALILSILFWLPGVIYALLVVFDVI